MKNTIKHYTFALKTCYFTCIVILINHVLSYNQLDNDEGSQRAQIHIPVQREPGLWIRGTLSVGIVVLKYGKPGRGPQWVLCLESAKRSALQPLQKTNFSTLPNSPCLFNGSQKSLTRLTNHCHHFYVVFIYY